jgi:outer membrane lipase/esterase
MNSEALAAFFGLTALPSNQSGGTNYATSGARSAQANAAGEELFLAAVPMATQISNYLAAVGGRANAKALYLISGGGNDIAFAENQSRSIANFPIFPLGSAAADTYIVNQANLLVASIAQLKAAGARYILVPDLPFSFPGGAGNADTRADRLLYSATLWSGLAAAGVNFIPADFNSVRLAISANPSAFGFEFVDTALGHTACIKPATVDSAWALLCSSNPGAPSTFASPTADQTRLFADNEHLSTAGQRSGPTIIQPDRCPEPDLVPSRERGQGAHAFISAAQNQINVSQDQRGPAGFNVATGDVSYLSMNNYQGFPNDPSNTGDPCSRYRLQGDAQLIVGGAISTGTLRSSFSTTGDFTQDEIAASIYVGFRGGPWWGNTIATYGHLDYGVNRTVPIGITLQFNKGNTSGNNWSLATEGGHKFKEGPLTHGPVVGLTLQRVTVGDFTEAGSFTSLSFGEQTRDSALSTLGYRATLDWGLWRPFAQVAWNHELADTDREVTASLTTVSFAPSYSMPAVLLGRDWGTASVGTTLKLGPATTLLGSVTTDFGQHDVRTYGAQFGLNIAF